jgi:hypothetical protein
LLWALKILVAGVAMMEGSGGTVKVRFIDVGLMMLKGREAALTAGVLAE